MSMSFSGRRALLCALALATIAGGTHAADWKPDRPVTIVVPYAPGGGTDTQTHAVAKELATLWAQPVIVENLGGADGVIGTRRVIDAKPNGLTLLVNLPAIALIKHTPTFKGIDPLASLIPVTAFSTVPGVLVTNASLPAKTMGELVRHCKTAATPCSFGTTENVARLQARVLSDTELPNLIVANYKGGGQLVSDLVANNVNMALMGITAVLPHHRSGALRVVMTMGDRRSAVLPDVQTAVEAGFPILAMPTWYGIFAPKGTPPEIVDGIAAAVREAIRQDSVKKTFATIGAEAIGNTPAEFSTLVKVEVDRVGALARRYPLE